MNFNQNERKLKLSGEIEIELRGILGKDAILDTRKNVREGFLFYFDSIIERIKG